MLRKWFQRWRGNAADAEPLYAAIVAQARQPAFHARLHVPDTVMGRYQMIALHVILLLDRLLAETDARQVAPARELARLLQEQMFDHMDAALRELGVSDLGVPKRMQKLAELFFGQMKSYRAALARSGDEALQAALARNVHAETEEAALTEEGAARLAAYARAAREGLARTPFQALLAGRIEWPAIIPGDES